MLACLLACCDLIPMHAFAFAFARTWEETLRENTVWEMEMQKQIKQTEITSSDSYMIEDPVQRAKRWIEEQQEKLMLEQEIGELKPKADYVDEILKSNGTMTVTQIAADYGLSATKLNKILDETLIFFEVIYYRQQ